MKTLTDGERFAIGNALRIAAEQYDADALVHGEEPKGGGLMDAQGRARLKLGFETQAADARRFAGLFENSVRATVYDDHDDPAH